MLLLLVFFIGISTVASFFIFILLILFIFCMLLSELMAEIKDVRGLMKIQSIIAKVKGYESYIYLIRSHIALCIQSHIVT